MKVEAAIQQLNLRYVRYLVRHVNRLDEFKADDKVKERIEEKQRLMSKITEDVKIVQSVEQELRDRYETLSSKDRYMEKKLKNEFPTLGKNAFVAVSVQYKRRPRTVLRTTSSAEVMDLGKCIISMNKLVYLTPECSEYLKQLEILDARPAALPQSVDASHWENLVAIRRIKVVNNFRIQKVYSCIVIVSKLNFFFVTDRPRASSTGRLARHRIRQQQPETSPSRTIPTQARLRFSRGSTQTFSRRQSRTRTRCRAATGPETGSDRTGY